MKTQLQIIKPILLCLLGFLFSLTASAQLKKDFSIVSEKQIFDGTYNADSKYFTTISSKGITVWNTSDAPKKLKKIKIKNIVHAVSVGSTAFVARKEKAFSNNILIEEYSIPDGKAKKIASLTGAIIFIHPSKDGKFITAYQKNKSISIIERSSGKIVKTQLVKDYYVTDAVTTNDGTLLAVAGSNKKLLVYKTDSMRVIFSNSFNFWSRCIEFSEDDMLMMVGDDGGIIHKFIFDDPNFVFTGYIETQSGRITRLRYSSGEKTFVAGTNQGNVIVYAVDNSKPLWKGVTKPQTIKAFDTSPNGRYLTYTGNLSNKINFYDFRVAAATPVQKTKIKNKKDNTPPQIAVSYPPLVKDRFITAREEITIRGFALDDYGLNSATLNGQKIKISSASEFEIPVKLSIGENIYSIEADDINGNQGIKKFRIVRQDSIPESEMLANAKNYLMVIGIDKYTSWPQLTNAVYDATSLTALLQQKYGFLPENTFTVLDSTATKQGVLDVFKKVVETVGVNDNLLIYYSGHGFFDNTFGEGYWIPVNGVKGQESDYIPNSTILQLMKRVNAKHTLLVADACFSGSLFEESNRGYIESVSQLRSRWAITSGRLEYVSDGAFGKHSPFNETILSILTNNTKDALPVSELLQQVKTEVANKTQQTPVGNPLKNAGDEGGEFIFRLKK
jgi:WD40 repeat protein